MSVPFYQDIAHAAVSVLKKVDNQHLQMVAHHELTKKFPHVAEELIGEHFDFAARFLERACFYAGKVRDEKFPEDKAMERLKAEFPNMIEGDYFTAMAHGYFVSR